MQRWSVHRKWNPLAWRLRCFFSKCLGVVPIYWQHTVGFSSQTWLAVTCLLWEMCHWNTWKETLSVQNKRRNVVIWRCFKTQSTIAGILTKVLVICFLCHIFSIRGFFCPCWSGRRGIFHLALHLTTRIATILLGREWYKDQEHFHDQSQRHKRQKLLNTFDVVFLSSNKWEISFKKGFLRIKMCVADRVRVFCVKKAHR